LESLQIHNELSWEWDPGLNTKCFVYTYPQSPNAILYKMFSGLVFWTETSHMLFI
jgi:hypothetical protein